MWIQYRYCFSVCVFVSCFCCSSSLLSRPVIVLRRLRPEMRILLNLALGKIRRRKRERERESRVVWKRQQQHFLWQYPARTRVKDWGKGAGWTLLQRMKRGRNEGSPLLESCFFRWVLSQGGEREDRKGVSIGIINPLQHHYHSASLSPPSSSLSS